MILHQAGRSVLAAAALASDSINTSLEMLTGKHSVVVRAWDTSGNYGDKTITVTIP